MSIIGSIAQASAADLRPATAIGPEVAGPNGLRGSKPVPSGGMPGILEHLPGQREVCCGLLGSRLARVRSSTDEELLRSRPPIDLGGEGATDDHADVQ